MVVRAFGLIAVVTMLLTGCGSLNQNNTPPQVVIKEVPIEVCEDPYQGLHRDLPVLPIHKLTSKDPSRVTGAYYESVKILMDEVKWYRVATGMDTK